MLSGATLQLLVAVFVGGTAGALGSFMILRRMALVGDALTHVALPGIGLALLLQQNPFLGAFAALFLAVIGIWWLKEKTKLPFEALVGIFFTGSLALGVLVVPDHELVEALFGDITSLKPIDGLVAIILALVVAVALGRIKSAFILSTISEDVAKASKISVSRTNFIYLFLVALIVALGVKFVGALLMGALVVIPAAAAQNVARGFSQYMGLSAAFGVASGALGVALHLLTDFPPGPLVVLVSVLIFFLTFLSRRV